MMTAASATRTCKMTGAGWSVTSANDATGAAGGATSISPYPRMRRKAPMVPMTMTL